MVLGPMVQLNGLCLHCSYFLYIFFLFLIFGFIFIVFGFLIFFLLAFSLILGILFNLKLSNICFIFDFKIFPTTFIFSMHLTFVFFTTGTAFRVFQILILHVAFYFQHSWSTLKYKLLFGQGDFTIICFKVFLHFQISMRHIYCLRFLLYFTLLYWLPHTMK